MCFRRAIIILIAGLVTASPAFTPDELRNYFEWGEYQELIDLLEPYLAVAPDTLDSAECARYHLYLGVALYGKGRVGDAQKHFLSALKSDALQRPDRQYISEAIDNLFSATLSDFSEQQRRKRENDSLLVQRQQAFDANVKALRREELRRGHVAGTLISVSMITLGAAFAGAAAYEYYSTKTAYNDFRAAAARGDRMEYDRLQPIVRRANGIIAGCAITAGIGEVAGIFFVIRTRMQQRAARDHGE